MPEVFTQNLKNFINSRVWFLKAVVTSWISACADFGISFAAFAWLQLDSGISAALGAVSGGIINCIFNYRWTFQVSDIHVGCVVVKYILIWIGSLLLNSYGTEIITQLFLTSTTLDEYGISRNLRFTIARLLVAITVSVFWNLNLQNSFVFRKVAADDVLIKLYRKIRNNMTSCKGRI